MVQRTIQKDRMVRHEQVDKEMPLNNKEISPELKYVRVNARTRLGQEV